MNKYFSFFAGVAVGAAATYAYLKYSEKKAEEEKRDEGHKEALEQLDDIAKPEEETEEKDPEDHYSKEDEKVAYNFYTQSPKEEHIRLITEDELQSNPEYEWVTIILYSDGVIVNDDTKTIMTYDQLVSAVGHKALDAMHIQDGNVVYVANDNTKTHFDIIEEDHPFISDPGDSE